jgi:hypothetical protein
LHRLDLVRPDALAPARHRGALQRQFVLKVALAAERLEVRVLHPLGTDFFVGQRLDVLQKVQADHQPGRQAGASLLGVKRTVLPLEARPVDQPG